MMNDFVKTVKKVLAILFLTFNIFSFKNVSAQVQSKSDFEILEGKNDSDIVYRGTLTFEDIRLVPAFHFEEAVKEYKPKKHAVKDLSGHLSNYELIVFLGTWCPDSHKMIPELYKVLELAKYPPGNVSLHGLDRDKLDKNGVAADFKIVFVPTIIVLKNGNEIGRITEVPDKSVEQDLLKIIGRN